MKNLTSVVYLSLILVSEFAFAGGGGGCNFITPQKNLFSCQIKYIESTNQEALNRDYQPNIIYGGREDLQNALKTVGTKLVFFGGSQNDVTGNPADANSCPVEADEYTRIYRIEIPFQKVLSDNKPYSYNLNLSLYGSHGGVVIQEASAFDSEIHASYNYPSREPVENPFSVKYTFVRVSQNPGESEATLLVSQNYQSMDDHRLNEETVIRAKLSCD